MSRHATDVVSLVFGLVFAGLAVNWALVVTDVTDLSDTHVTVPVILIGAGIAGLISILGRGRRATDAAGYSAEE